MDPTLTPQITALLHSHAWIALAILVIPTLDKLIAEGSWPFTIAFPVKYRVALILVGSVTVGALQKIQAGDNLADAIASAVVVAVFAFMKNGGSLFVKADDGADAAPTLKKIPPLPVLLFALALAGCATWKRDAKTALDVVQTVCILSNATLPNAEILTACGIVDDLAPIVDKVLTEHRSQVAAAAKAGACK